MEEWIKLLRKAVAAEGGQAAVARKLSYSPAAISMALADKYNGGTEALAAKVLQIYGGKTMTEKPVPDGYMRNALGMLVPLENVKEVDLARDEFVRQMAAKALEMSRQLSEFKVAVSSDVQAFAELSAEQYQADVGGQRGNLTLTSYDGKYKLMRCVSDRLDFDERLQAAKSLVDECLREWTRDSRAEIRALIDQAFQTDQKGKINTKRILALRQLKIEHPTWQRAMEAVGDAITVTGSCTYYRFYERDERGEYRQIPLDFSGV